METLPFEPFELVAIDPGRNIRRRWQVRASRDLFDMLVVETCWGRIGQRGQYRCYRFADEQAALRHVRALLARRGTARQRLGVPYVPRNAEPNYRFISRRCSPCNPAHPTPPPGQRSA
jgi:predicted DNA-binding WGR domain protein